MRRSVADYTWKNIRQTSQNIIRPFFFSLSHSQMGGGKRRNNNLQRKQTKNKLELKNTNFLLLESRFFAGNSTETSKGIFISQTTTTSDPCVTLKKKIITRRNEKKGKKCSFICRLVSPG
jgi:hypothetical protein